MVQFSVHVAAQGGAREPNLCDHTLRLGSAHVADWSGLMRANSYMFSYSFGKGLLPFAATEVSQDAYISVTTLFTIRPYAAIKSTCACKVSSDSNKVCPCWDG